MPGGRLTRSHLQESDAGVPRRRRRLSRRWRAAALTALTLLLAFVVATGTLFIWPVQGMPGQASAIVLLAGPGDRLPVALRLAAAHRAPVLVVSQGYDGYGGPCPPRPAGVTLICFDPSPPTTRGEAEHIGQLARRYHWTSVLVVASRPQATRARMLVERCFAGPVYIATAPLPLGSWPYQLAYGWGALIKAVVAYRNC